MQKYMAALTFLLLIGLVVTRLQLLKRKGIQAMQFGKLDKKDYLIPPFALFYFYLVLAHAFKWPTPATRQLVYSSGLGWLGVILCLVGLLLLAWSLLSFGQSFRVGIDTEHPDKLVTSGAFAFSRNPIYTAFAFILLGEFLIFPNWVPLLYLVAAVWLFHRQVLREEEYMKEHYGADYAEYCRKVRRYL